MVYFRTLNFNFGAVHDSVVTGTLTVYEPILSPCHSRSQTGQGKVGWRVKELCDTSRRAILQERQSQVHDLNVDLVKLKIAVE